MNSKVPERLKEIIPLYLQGRLSNKEKQNFEEALKKYPELNRELMEFKEIKEVCKELEDETPLIDAETVFRRTINNIRKTDEVTLHKRNFIQRLQDLLKNIFSSYRLSWGIVAVQFMIILLLVSTLPRQYKYRTLTSEGFQQSYGTKVNIVFKEEAKEKEVRRLLTKVGAKIVWGPSPEGLYVIEIKEAEGLEETLKVLKESTIVKFVEKTF